MPDAFMMQPASTKSGNASKDTDWLPSAISWAKLASGIMSMLMTKKASAPIAIAQVMGVDNRKRMTTSSEGPARWKKVISAIPHCDADGQSTVFRR